MDSLRSITSYAGYPPASRTSGTPSAESSQTAARAEAPTAGDTGEALHLPEDRVTLSGQQPGTEQSPTTAADQKPASPAEKSNGPQTRQDPQIEQRVAQLKQVEDKVKAHEAAHKSAGGSLAGSASYSYTQGPDGRSYVTGGEVQIDMSAGQTPAETVSRMQQVIRAALAPADPSGQDRAVAAQAASQMAQAQQQKTQSESPTATPKSEQATAPTTAGSTTTQAASTPDGSRVQQAYGNPAVQGKDNAPADQSGTPPVPSSTRRPAGGTETAARPLFSAVA